MKFDVVTTANIGEVNAITAHAVKVIDRTPGIKLFLSGDIGDLLTTVSGQSLVVLLEAT